jgi:RNA polymerase sigma-70 factor (ECF subfamily)
MQEPDPQVVAAARGGSLSAFEDLVRLFQADVWRFSLHLLGNESSAEDTTQETFIRAFRFLDRYRGESKFSTWLLSIARNCAMDEVRKAGRIRRIQDRSALQPEPDLHDESIGIEVREALQSLDIGLREPVVLIDMFGASYQDVATVLGVPVGTVKSRVHRAREILVRKLRVEMGEGADG